MNRRNTKENLANSLLMGAFEALEKVEDVERLLKVCAFPYIEQLHEYSLTIASAIETDMLIKFE